MGDIEAFEKGKYFIYKEIDNYKNEFNNFNKILKKKLKKKNKEINKTCKKQLEEKIKTNPNKYIKTMLETIKDNSEVIQTGGHIPKNVSYKLDNIIKTQKINQNKNTNFLEDIYNKLSNKNKTKNIIFTYIQIFILILIGILLLYIVYKVVIEGEQIQDLLKKFKESFDQTTKETDLVSVRQKLKVSEDQLNTYQQELISRGLNPSAQIPNQSQIVASSPLALASQPGYTAQSPHPLASQPGYTAQSPQIVRT
jgi:sugar-specific transcriptional regulator TrmB